MTNSNERALHVRIPETLGNDAACPLTVGAYLDADGELIAARWQTMQDPQRVTESCSCRNANGTTPVASTLQMRLD